MNQEKYRPTQEEENKAKDIMTPEQNRMSQERESSLVSYMENNAETASIVDLMDALDKFEKIEFKGMFSTNQISTKKAFGRIFLKASRRKDLAPFFGEIVKKIEPVFDHQDFVNANPIDVMCNAGNLPGLQAVIEAGEKLKYSGFPMFYAARSGDTELVKWLLEQEGASHSKHKITTSQYSSSRDRVLPLVGAAKAGNIDIVKILLEAGASPNKALNGAIHEAAAVNGHTEIIRVLAEAGADIKGCPYVVDAVIDAGQMESLGVLLELGGENLVSRAFNVALEKKDLSVLRLLIDSHGVSPEDIFSRSREFKSDITVMRFLVDDFNLDCTGDAGANALSTALADGEPDTVTFLLSKKTPTMEGNRNPVSQMNCVLSAGSKESLKILFSQPGVDKEKLSRMTIDAIEQDYENEIANSYTYDDEDGLEQLSVSVQSAKEFVKSL